MSFFGQNNNNNQQSSGFGGFGSSNNTTGGTSYPIFSLASCFRLVHLPKLPHSSGSFANQLARLLMDISYHSGFGQTATSGAGFGGGTTGTSGGFGGFGSGGQ